MARGEFRIRRCVVPGVMAVEATSRHAFPKHWHDQFGVGVILAGAQRSLSGRGTVEAGAGDLITVNPGEVHDGEPLGEAGRTWRMLYFDPPVIAAAVRDVARPAAAEFASPAFSHPGMAVLFGRLYAAMTTDAVEMLARDELMLELAAGLLAAPEATAPRGTAAPIDRARSLIDDAPARTVTLAALARAAGLSRFQVLRGFVRATGLTPHAYLMQQRIALARRLIAAGTGLAEAAAASGFADQSHMTRLFVRTFGLSPGRYAAALG
ncbi:AraC family transcriptional regulator [Phreatobacter sp. AB_2022a]|uniref:AraC family transcriptional regulator n=1 Tax=Phreatobacter sp. AB_2022a TaxID=3003134 RepID=UPI0022870ECF|nr:AraC family transcriptional regulator [Phreatobacter sp. AB_2022a]MCZ0735499.1 AraC family transcriptional regulator [Phreatobacter sp. AB_2022a]